MYLIDTNIVIWVLRGIPEYVDIILRLKDKGALSISVIAIAEIYKNVFPEEMLRTEGVLKEFEVWDVTPEIAKQSGMYWSQYSKRLRSLELLDCLIAATAREHELTLVTLNTRHFPMGDIRIVDPLKKSWKKIS